MFRTILVPLDGSQLAERALSYAEVMAKANGARILLLRVVPAPRFAVGDPTPDQARAIRDAEAYLADAAAKLTKPTIIETAVFVGDAADSIIEEIDLRNVDLVVMSTHGRSGFGRWVYGSVADEVMRHAGVPVLLVPVSCQVSWPSSRPPRLLVPLDGSDLARVALVEAADLATWLEAEMYALRVVSPIAYAYSDSAPYLNYNPTEDLKEAHSYLDAVVADLCSRGQTIRVLEAVGPVAAMIAATAAEQGVDLIVMSTHGNGGITRLLMGSVTTGVIQQSWVPIMIIRPRAVRQHAERQAATEEAEKTRRAG
jgi:nucleotide-binding universal stress UspA family protein